MLIMMHGAGGICPAPRWRAWKEEEEEEDWGSGRKGLSRLAKDLVFSLFSFRLHLCPSSLLFLARPTPYFFFLLPNPNIKRKQNGAFAHLSEQRLQVRGRRTMGIEQGLFLFVYLAHSLTPEVVLFFFIFLVVVLFFLTCVCTGNLCVCVSARK